jgi:hypothetical protein
MTDKEDFTSLFERLPVPAYRTSPQGKLTRANAALISFNRSADETALLAYANTSDWYVLPDRRSQFRTILQTQGQISNFVS